MIHLAAITVGMCCLMMIMYVNGYLGQTIRFNEPCMRLQYWLLQKRKINHLCKNVKVCKLYYKLKLMCILNKLVVKLRDSNKILCQDQGVNNFNRCSYKSLPCCNLHFLMCLYDVSSCNECIVQPVMPVVYRSKKRSS